MSTEKRSKKNLKFTSLAWVFAAILTAVVILVNVAASYLDKKIDMTPESVYTMSDTTKDYINSLDKDVDLYFLMKLDALRTAPDSNEVSELITFLEQYSRFDRIHFHDIDINEDPDVVKELDPENALGLTNGDIVTRCGSSVKRIPRTSLYYYEKDDNNVAISKTFYGENLITSAVKSVVDAYSPVIYFTVGHGEKSLDKDYKSYGEALRRLNYDPKPIDLEKNGSVPGDAAIVVIAGPQKDISKNEKTMLDRFLDGGGDLSLLMSPQDSGTDFDNILDIMHEYHLGMDYTRAYETDASKFLDEKYNIAAQLFDLSNVNTQSGASTDMNDLQQQEQASLEGITDLTSGIINSGEANYAIYMPQCRTFFEYDPENTTNFRICPLMITSDTARVEAYGGDKSRESDKEIDQLNSEDSFNIWNNLDTNFWLAAYSEDVSRAESKLVVMPTAEILTDENIAKMAIPATLYNSTLNWMQEVNIDMGISDKKRTTDYMKLETKEDTDLILVIITAAPIIVALAGVLIWLKRRHS